MDRHYTPPKSFGTPVSSERIAKRLEPRCGILTLPGAFFMPTRTAPGSHALADVPENMTTGRVVLMKLASSASWPSTKTKSRDGPSRIYNRRSPTCPSAYATRKTKRNAEELMRRSRLAPNLLGAMLLLVGTPAHLILLAHAFYFQWFPTSYQCYLQTLS